MIFYENLDEIVFHRHEMFDIDELVVLSGYVGPKPIERLENLPLQTQVIYGMYGSDGIGKGLHNTLQKLETNIDNVQILYSQIPVHSKCYIWRKNQKIQTALIGSANFSLSGLTNPYKEILSEATHDSFDPLNEYLKKILSFSQDCKKIDSSQIKFKSLGITERLEKTLEVNGQARMDLLNRSGEISPVSGLNWGVARLSGSHTSEGDAYIAITRALIERFPDLFPPKLGKVTNLTEGAKITRQNDAVEFIWDDGTTMEGLLEGTQNIGGIDYPKQMCSGPKKSILGKYLRKRMGIKDIDYVITKKDLEKYGRTDIGISLQGEGVYELDFAPLGK